MPYSNSVIDHFENPRNVGSFDKDDEDVGVGLITITESAKNKINDILYGEKNPNSALRTFVQGGGCSGFQYGFQIDDVQNEDDFVVDTGAFRVYIDAMSMMYMDGAEIDYKEELMSCQFVIKNPNATNQCGCGSSFSI